MSYRPLAPSSGNDAIPYKCVEFVSYSPRYAKSDSHLQHGRLPGTGVCGIPASSANKIMSFAKWLLTLIVGIAIAQIAVFIASTTSRLVKWKFDSLQKLLADEIRGDTMAGSGILFLIGFNIVLVGVASTITTYWAPSSAGSGIPEIKSTLNGVQVKAWLSARTLFGKVVGIILSVSGGLPVGKEGPMIHSGAIIAAFFSSRRAIRCWNWRPMSFLKENDVRDLVTCGAAAGVAAAFGAPIGGVLFALEEGASFLSPKLIWRAFFCAMVATFVVFGSSISSFSEMANKSFLFAFGKMDDPEVDTASYLPWELLVFVVIGSTGGVIGAIFTQINKYVLFRANVSKLPRYGKVLYVIGISLVLSVTWFFLSGAVGTCRVLPTAVAFNDKAHLVRHTCPLGQYNDLASLFLTPPESTLKNLLHLPNPVGVPPTFTITSLVVFGTLYFLGTAFVFGASITSGVFVPSIIVGAAFGRIAGQWLHAGDMDFINISTYALVGAAAVLGGVTRMTISLTIILLEATGDLQFALPLMMTLMPARWIGNLLSPGLYEAHIRCRGIPFLDWGPPPSAEHMSVLQVTTSDMAYCLGKRERVGSIVAALAQRPHQTSWAVVDRRYDAQLGVYENLLEGTIQRHVLVSLLRHKSTWTPFHARNATESESGLPDDSDVLDVEAAPDDDDVDASLMSTADMDCFVNLELYVNPSPTQINVEASAAQAYRQFRALGLSLMCVVSKRGELVGVVTRTQLHSLALGVIVTDNWVDHDS
ncbi:hypothetical protein LEN26_005800 [Aphanomyces euteiches]|nr:hypothetical protein AeMF1_015869 [Aphanomyces euteiches]KAH9137280.1 hypothetical protein LEN26_005800 [Aphanomyces euteiches]KAH9195401.1 hypothetical protein AeNC1_002609 [Aphanomyces euteiches]